jgi:hypothetical protein
VDANSTDRAARPALTTWRVEAALRRLDRMIAAAEEWSGFRNPAELRALTALKQERTELKLLLVARRIEVKKRLISLQRWRDGFGAGEDALSDTGT